MLLMNSIAKVIKICTFRAMTKIRIVAPAKAIEKSHIEFAKKFLETNGFNVEISANCVGNHHYFSGTDAERHADFQEALDDKSVDAILCARGGYGSVRIIDQLNFTKFLENPKLIIGFSDVTVFHNHIQGNYNLPTIHGSAPLDFKTNTTESLGSLLDVLNHNELRYKFDSNILNRLGETISTVIGGNLSILYSLIGTNSDIDYDHKILFIEEVGEYVYTIDRMMWALKKSGKLDHIKGLIVGGFTKIGDSETPFGQTYKEVILSHTNHLDIPICFDFPAGHIDDNRAIILGKKAKLLVDSDSVVFEQ